MMVIAIAMFALLYLIVAWLLLCCYIGYKGKDYKPEAADIVICLFWPLIVPVAVMIEGARKICQIILRSAKRFTHGK